MMMQEDLDQNNSTPVEEQENGEENGEETTEEATEVVATETVVETAAPAESAEVEERVPHRKIRTGLVVSDKMEKSIVVLVTRRVKHPLYKKYYFKSKKYMAHDETNDCAMGDTVRIAETRPMSARKRWTLETIVERAK